MNKQRENRTIETFRSEYQADVGCPCAPGWDGEKCALEACSQNVCRTTNGISSCVQPMAGLDHVLHQIPKYTTRGKAIVFVGNIATSPIVARPKEKKQKDARIVENALNATLSLGRHHLFHTAPSNIKYRV